MCNQLTGYVQLADGVCSVSQRGSSSIRQVKHHVLQIARLSSFVIPQGSIQDQILY